MNTGFIGVSCDPWTESSAEYEEARAEVETFPQPPDEAKPADRDENEDVTPAGKDGVATAGTPSGGGDHRLAAARVGSAGPRERGGHQRHHPRDPEAMERPVVVPVVDPAKAMDLLFEDNAGRSDDAAAVGGRQCSRARALPAPVVNLKKDRGPLPDNVRSDFRELCRQPRIDGLLQSIDAWIEPLERSAVPDLEAARREVAALRRIARPAPEAAPGRLVDALRRLGSLSDRTADNPRVLIGELDLLGLGEAAADALLGAHDPMRNSTFRDRYVGLPLNLAGVLFVAAATDSGRIPALLRERLEVLPLAGYADAEKEQIAASHLIPQRRGQHGLSGEDPSFFPAALRLLIGGYAREPGVRVLGHRIDVLCLRAARLRAEGFPLRGEMGPESGVAWLGAPPFRDEGIAARPWRPGGALGLAATPEGGGVLVVEATCLPGRGRLRVTGRVGTVMRKSVGVALTWVRSHADRFAGVAAKLNDATHLHLHVADAGHSKDGPSAGITFAAALVSALTGQRCVAASA